MSETVPESRHRKRPTWLHPVWIVPVACLIGLGWFVYQQTAGEGPSIVITFIDGRGLEAGKTELRFHGVKAGSVESVSLSKDLARVDVDVTLERSASGLAREGSLFWVVRPNISASGIRGLGAIVSGSFISAIPGHGRAQKRFEGLEEPPAVEGELRGLQIYVLSKQPVSFSPEAPVYYRSIKVGAVADSSLSPDAASVRTRVVIERPYQKLVRENTRFWNAGGVHVHLGLGGLDIRATSFEALISGGMEFATPDASAPEATQNAEFTLEAKEKDAWKSWDPKIPLGQQPPQTER